MHWRGNVSESQTVHQQIPQLFKAFFAMHEWVSEWMHAFMYDGNDFLLGIHIAETYNTLSCHLKSNLFIFRRSMLHYLSSETDLSLDMIKWLICLLWLPYKGQYVTWNVMHFYVLHRRRSLICGGGVSPVWWHRHRNNHLSRDPTSFTTPTPFWSLHLSTQKNTLIYSVFIRHS